MTYSMILSVSVYFFKSLLASHACDNKIDVYVAVHVSVSLKYYMNRKDSWKPKYECNMVSTFCEDMFVHYFVKYFKHDFMLIICEQLQ